MPPTFSRLQLAAALIEYDNDSSNPNARFRSAHDSAIFAPLRRLKQVRPEPSTRNSYLSVALPSDTASLAPRQSVAMESRRSRASVSALRNMFGHEHDYDDEEGSEVVDDAEEGLDMDLASWGIDNLLSKDAPAKGKQKQMELPNPHSERPVSVLTRNVTAQRRPANTRTRSLGNFDQFLDETTLERDNTRLSERHRRASIGSPLDLAGIEQSTEPLKPFNDQAQAVEPPEHGQTVPFPSYDDVDPAGRSVSQLAHYRTQSTASMGSRMLSDEPKPRTYSTASMGTAVLDDNPFALRPPSVVSRFDPKARDRAFSTASMGTRAMLDVDDSQSTMTSRPPFNRASTTMDLLRPKVLVMPSPLQPPNQSRTDIRTTEGFEVSIGGTPLPPGARSARKSSYFGTGSSGPDASNLFTPNPRLNMTLSQLTFRNQLMVDGQRDVTYIDIDRDLARATEEGQQVEMPVEMEEEDDVEPEVDGNNKPYRPAGKLYGKSLIDDLEARKANMRGKQRVFTGDQRPSMMQRGVQRQSTLIDPASLKIHPEMKRMSSFGIQSAIDPRRHSSVKPLLSFESQENLPAGGRPIPGSRSVFGVDVLWERETAKLKEIEALEKKEEEERLKREEEENSKSKKKNGKGKDKSGLATSPSPSQLANNAAEPAPTRVSIAPPVLPVIEKASARPPPPADDKDDVESDESADEATHKHAKKPSTETKRWFAGDSDEEKEKAPVKTTGVGPRYRQVFHNNRNDSDSEEDVPLAATINRVIERQRNTTLAHPDGDSDEDKPLNALLGQKPKFESFSVNLDRPSIQQNKDDDDDDAPLGLRASRFVPPASQSRDEDDDDKPLALHPEQQRRTQFIAAAQQQQQQQQQQMMMQMQMQNSMFFPPAPPSMMGFPPPMMMPQMAPIPAPSPPPIQDPANFGRVDRWRHDVAVEGEH